jgi:hypothetical protein
MKTLRLALGCVVAGAVLTAAAIDLYLQKDSPGKDKESNWLPAPEGRFVLMLRLYWLKEAFLDGTWQPPAVRRVEK